MYSEPQAPAAFHLADKSGAPRADLDMTAEENLVSTGNQCITTLSYPGK
jgi:hypothetical protein